MSIVSFYFLFFALIISVLFFVAPKKWQWIVLLCGNIFFYAYAGVKYLVVVFFMTLVSFITALRLEEAAGIGAKVLPSLDNEAKNEVKKHIISIKQYICAVSIIFVAGIWVVLKYGNFFIKNINALISRFSEGIQISKVPWALPLGISFYTFHIIGYVVDVYRGKYHAERNFARYFTFITFFPHVIQGPFSRFDLLGKSIFEEHAFSYDRLCEGCARILWGFFKKLVIADRLGVAVNSIFINYSDYSGVHIIFGMFAYCIELYADFSGYMDIVCGLSHIWGISLSENFRRPYFAKSIDEFWRRWHITLGAWFKDYVFYPVSMGKIGQKLGKKARNKWGARMGKLVPGYFALIFVWTATGLWHGANWTYLIWGYLNLFVIMSTMQLSDFYDKIKKAFHIKSDSMLWNSVCIIRTFILVCFFRFFSIQSSLKTALATLKHTFSNLRPGDITSLQDMFVGMLPKDIYSVIVGTIILFIVDAFSEAGKWKEIKDRCPAMVRNIIYALLVMVIIIFSGESSDLTGGFMYANF